MSVGFLAPGSWEHFHCQIQLSFSDSQLKGKGLPSTLLSVHSGPSRARADSELLPLSGFLIPWPLVIGEPGFYKTITAFQLRKKRGWMGLLREALRRGQRKACFPTRESVG